MLQKTVFSQIVENTITVVTVIALSVFPRYFLLDDVRTAAVRTCHPIWSSLFTEILQTIFLVRQKYLVDALFADHIETNYELRSQRGTHRYRRAKSGLC
jgi:hypothetical protein